MEQFNKATVEKAYKKKAEQNQVLSTKATQQNHHKSYYLLGGIRQQLLSPFLMVGS